MKITIFLFGATILVSSFSIIAFGSRTVKGDLIRYGFRPLDVDVASSKDDSFWKEKLDSIPGSLPLKTNPSWLAYDIKTAKLICADLFTISKRDSDYSSGFNMAKNYCSVPAKDGH